jgi:hypothetical protein
MCRSLRGYDIAGVERGEFNLWLIPHQKIASLYWRSDTHTHTLSLPEIIILSAANNRGYKNKNNWQS